MPTYDHQVARLWAGIRSLCVGDRYEHRLRGAYTQLLLVNRDVVGDLDEYHALVRAFAIYGGMGGGANQPLAGAITVESFELIVDLYLSFYQKVRAGAHG